MIEVQDSGAAPLLAAAEAAAQGDSAPIDGAPARPARPTLEAAERLGDTGPRGRLLAAMAAAVSENGYSGTTVADVVRIARTSRRTFYEHFDDLDDCFLALGDAISEYLLGLVAEAASPELPWRERVERAIDVYLQAMAANPGLTRSFLLELFGMGARGLRHRRAVHRRAAEQLRALVEAGREQNPELNPISFETATAIVGGLWELSLLGAEQGRRQDAAELRRTAVQLISDVLTAPRERH